MRKSLKCACAFENAVKCHYKTSFEKISKLASGKTNQFSVQFKLDGPRGDAVNVSGIDKRHSKKT